MPFLTVTLKQPQPLPAQFGYDPAANKPTPPEAGSITPTEEIT